MGHFLQTFTFLDTTLVNSIFPECAMRALTQPRKWPMPVLAAVVAALTAVGPTLGADTELIGTYEFIGATVTYQDTGEVVPDVFGKEAKGFIMYGNDGRMLVLITYAGRPKPERTEKITDEQRIALYNTMQAYGGTYTFDGKTVQHHVDICWDEVRCGTTVARDIERNGDTLVLKTHPGPFAMNGRTVVNTIVWRKIR
jgi:hypothetical protein